MDQQPWNYLLVPQISSENTLESVIVDLFGSVLQQKICPKCFHDNHHNTSLSLVSCPRNLFLRFDPIIATGNTRTNLMPHMDLTKIVSDKIIHTSSYACYTLQSFIVFYGTDDKGHFVTFAQKKGEWYRLDDLDVSLVRSSSVFGDQADSKPVLLAHYTRPLDSDIFSIALWNVFTNFPTPTGPLPSSLSLNDAVILFAKSNIIKK